MCKMTVNINESSIMKRDSRFSFECNRCSRCCYNKTIKVNPYEVARLAANRAIDTTVFIREYTVSSGTALRVNTDGSCVFLSSNGCTVHPDRPFVCRLYPLQRRIDSSGAETFLTVTLHSQCEGELGTGGTVAGYLAGQEAEEYIEAVDEYLRLTGEILAALDQEITAIRNNITDGKSVSRETSTVPDVDEVSQWLDTDYMLSRHGHLTDKLKETNAGDKMHQHISIIEAMLKSMKGTGSS